MNGRRARAQRRARREAEAAAPGLAGALARIRAERDGSLAELRRRHVFAGRQMWARYEEMLRARPRATLHALNDDALKAWRLLEDRYRDAQLEILDRFAKQQQKLLRAGARAA